MLLSGKMNAVSLSQSLHFIKDWMKKRDFVSSDTKRIMPWNILCLIRTKCDLFPVETPKGGQSGFQRMTKKGV